MAPVACSNAVPPAELNSRFTTHWTWFCGTPAEAVFSWLPSIRVGPSRYFSVFSSLQENSGWSDTSGKSARFESQVYAAKSVWSFSLGCHSMALSGAVP